MAYKLAPEYVSGILARAHEPLANLLALPFAARH